MDEHLRGRMITVRAGEQLSGEGEQLSGVNKCM